MVCRSVVMVSADVLQVVSHLSLVPIPCPWEHLLRARSIGLTAGCGGERSMMEAVIGQAKEIHGSCFPAGGCSRPASSLFRGASRFPGSPRAWAVVVIPTPWAAVRLTSCESLPARQGG